MTLCCDCIARLYVIFVLVLVKSTNARDCGSFLIEKIGYTEPSGDIVIEYGNSLDIYCVLNDEYVESNGNASSSRLSFVFGENTVLPKEMIDVVNSTTIKLHVAKPNCSKAWYKCVLDNHNVVCANYVFVGTKPKEVTDFSCISNNYDNLTCSWTAPENYVKTSYKLTYHLNGRAGRQHRFSCPVPPVADSKNRMSCFWNVSTTPQYRLAHDEFFFNLTMNNTFGERSMATVFNHFQHVRPGPPVNLQYTSKTWNSIYLQWKIPNALEHFPPGLHHRVLYQCEHGPKVWHLAAIIDGHNGTDKSKRMRYNLTVLCHAYEFCDIRVSLRSAKALQDDESMWSANASITVRLGSKVPGAPPKIATGSFEISTSGDHNRNVIIYWQQIPKEIQNGDGFKYKVAVVGEPRLNAYEITNTYAKFPNLSTDQSYRFKIWSENINGSSEGKSFIDVPKQSDLIAEPSGFTKISYTKGKYELTWDPPKDHSPVTHYILFWCNNKRDRPYPCLGHLNWTVLPATTTSKIITTYGVESEDQFAISAVSSTSSSGMVWAGCTVIDNNTNRKMKNVQINGIGSSYIDVGWKLECSDQIGSVKGFIVYYCTVGDPKSQTCKGPELNKTFYGDQSRSNGNVTGLTPYTTYMLSVSVLSKNNDESLRSKQLRNTTLEAAPNSPVNVRISNIKNSSVMVEWEPPKITNGILKHYEIHYNNESKKSRDPNETKFTLENLDVYTKYNITVVACTIACSQPSEVKSIKTSMGYPGSTDPSSINMLNASHLRIVWSKPMRPGGNIDYYELLLKKSDRENETLKLVNVTTGTSYIVEYCKAEQEGYNVYVTVRAVNIINGTLYKGPWSSESTTYCRGQQFYLLWIFLAICMVSSVIGTFFLAKKLYERYEMMKVVEIVLPQGLGDGVSNLKNTDWTQKRPEPDHHPSDEVHLLQTIGESRRNGDSSGCVSGQESTSSESASQASSDSGTEQPRNPTVRQRNTTPRNPPPKDYVLMPTDSSGSTTWSSKTTPSTMTTTTEYCVLGVDPTSPAAIQLPEEPCDSAPYVMTGDVPKIAPTPGYVPFGASDPSEKNNAGYVVAGNKSMLIPDLLLQQQQEKSSYVQVAPPPWTQQESTAGKSGYVSIGEAGAIMGVPEQQSKGYVPHRHFDGKSIKED